MLRADTLPEIPVLADRDQLQRALGNVLHNAIKFSPKNSVVCISAVAEDERVRIDVLDSGPGIPTPDLTRIFERFYRGDRSRRGAGTGLGLAIAKHVLQAHGGEMWAENTPKGGAKVSLTLIRADST
jgi:two-component system phosphate regulon sensor histidine kinase PhoR